jgi:prepilin-type processing-associated H-X9-DG protein
MNCQSNQKNVALAFQNYHDIHQSFPLGAKASILGTWALFTLPFIEQTALYSSYNFNRAYNNNTVDAGFTKGNLDLLSNLRIPTYSCPTDADRKSTYGSYMHHNMVVSVGESGTYFFDNPGTGTNNKGRGWAPYGDVTIDNGAMFWGGCRVGSGTSWSEGYKWVSLAAVSDGLSNTVAVSETVQGARHPTAHGAGTVDIRGLIWWGDGSVFHAYRTPNTRTPDNTLFTAPTTFKDGGTLHSPRHPIIALTNDIFVQSARSHHSGGVNAALADGAVRLFSDTINVNVWRAMATTRGGEVVSQ